MKWNETKKLFEINNKKTSWTHNHSLTYQGVSKATYNEVKTFIQKEHLKMAHTPAQTRDKMVAYINGRNQKQDLELNYQLCSYVHYTTKENLFGPAEEDANSLNKIFNLVKTNFPNSLCEISTKTKMVGEAQVSQLENFFFLQRI